ncbi:CPBP family intramembrane glutamic endopeptidase [Aestuariivivens sediminicola]|uniref:CPBP family intramembrane glutamic endopeptidase n=1 Tax=Aestuariivivens sediminicola TaxID=2913560 RepID=UPI001F587721|nr:CPBP family intramembrane glutamic endopeptidase [Aestuariivivens sediminicola]
MRGEEAIAMLITLVFATYFVITWAYYKLGITNLEKALFLRNGLRFLNLKHILGMVLFGVLFYVNYSEFTHLIACIEIPRLHILIPYILSVIALAYISKGSSDSAMARNDVVSAYGFSNAWTYFVIRFGFLLCYEFFFRGVLLFTLLHIMEIPMAIGLSILAYVLIHIFDSKKEILGAIPFGILLCVLTYITQSIWYAFIMHLTLSAVYEISIFYRITLKTTLS